MSAEQTVLDQFRSHLAAIPNIYTSPDITWTYPDGTQDTIVYAGPNRFSTDTQDINHMLYSLAHRLPGSDVERSIKYPFNEGDIHFGTVTLDSPTQRFRFYLTPSAKLAKRLYIGAANPNHIDPLIDGDYYTGYYARIPIPKVQEIAARRFSGSFPQEPDFRDFFERHIWNQQ